MPPSLMTADVLPAPAPAVSPRRRSSQPDAGKPTFDKQGVKSSEPAASSAKKTGKPLRRTSRPLDDSPVLALSVQAEGQAEHVPVGKCLEVDQERLARLLKRDIGFIHNPSFTQPKQAQAIQSESLADMDLSEHHGGRPKLPAYFASLYDLRLLSPDEEQQLFRRMNFLKYQAAKLRKRLPHHGVRVEQVDEIERLLDESDQVRKELIRCNMRLVVSIAKQYVSDWMSLDDLISEGNVTLIRAIEKFDYGRGFRFSTYATWSIRRNLFRHVVKIKEERRKSYSGEDDALEASVDHRSNEAVRERCYASAQASLNTLFAQLDRRDQKILSARFGLGMAARPKALQQVAKELGVSKERVRQLQMRAMQRLRLMAEELGITIPE